MTQLEATTSLKLRPKRISLAGVDTAYWTGGTRGGRPLVLLHGLSGSHHGLMPLAGEFLDYNIVLPDMPGHGESSLPAPKKDVNSLSDWFAAFINFVNQQTGKLPVIIAHSFGAQIALLACLKSGTVYAKCILLNPVPHLSLIPRLFEQSIAFAPKAVAYRMGVNQYMRYWRNFYLLARHDQKTIGIMQWVSQHGSTLPDNLAFYVDTSRELLNAASHYDEVGKTGNFYCIVGDRDHMTNGKAIAHLRNTFRDGHIVVCKNTGHLMPVEAPVETAELMRPMLEVI